MQIYNTTTGETVDLNYYDRRVDVAQQQDSAIDFCGSDPDIIYNQDEDRYEASQDAIDYWTAWFRATELSDETERGVRELFREAGEDDIEERIREDVDRNYSDFDAWPAQRYQLLIKLRNEALAEIERRNA